MGAEGAEENTGAARAGHPMGDFGDGRDVGFPRGVMVGEGVVIRENTPGVSCPHQWTTYMLYSGTHPLR